MKKSRKDNFDKLFYKREFKKLIGFKQYNLIILSSILFVSYFALAFLQNYKNQLKVQMDNPYTNWVSLDIPNQKVNAAEDIINNFQNRTLLNEYLLDTVSYYNIQHLDAINEISQKSLGKLRIRSISNDSKLLKRIIEENKMSVTKDDLEAECWSIINNNIFGSDKRPKDHLFLSVIRDKYMSIPILGSVNQLPDNCDVLVSEHMMSILQLRCASQQFRSEANENNVKVLLRDTVDVDNFIKDFELYSNTKVLYKDVKLKKINRFLYHWVTLSLNEFYGEDAFHLYLERQGLLAITNLECNAHRPCQIEDPYYLTFNFSALDKVGDLNQHLENEYGFTISLHDVKAKENFATVVKMAMSTSIIIIILSISSILLFLYHILDSHISSIKTSIGTLKAFGLPNNKIVRSYSVICGKLFLRASLIALILLMSIQLITASTWMNIMTLHSLPIVLTWIVSFVSIFYYCSRILKGMFNKTPGDLIYKR